jgi:hypothetical protein
MPMTAYLLSIMILTVVELLFYCLVVVDFGNVASLERGLDVDDVALEVKHNLL